MREAKRSTYRAADWTASGKTRGWGADRREKGDGDCVLRLDRYGGPNGRAAKRCNLRRSDRRRSTTRPVLEHLTLEAIVVSGMCWTAGNLRSITVAVPLGERFPDGVRVVVAHRLVRGREFLRSDPRHGPQRRPRQCSYRAPDNPRSPARGPAHLKINHSVRRCRENQAPQIQTRDRPIASAALGSSRDGQSTM